MNSIISQFIAEWGTLGAVLCALGWFAYENWKSNKNKSNQKNETLIAVQGLGTKIENLSDKIRIVDNKVDEFKSQLDMKIEILDAKVDTMPETNIVKMQDIQSKKDAEHLKQMDDLIKLGPKLHRIIQNANQMIGSDHIFVGSFHNGNSSLSGIPYYKFDIIAERFSPKKVARDCEFAHMYKDADILRFDMLPSLLVQNGLIHFIVPENGDMELSNYDDIIWRRMRGRGIRQIAIRMTRDSKGAPSGFVGVVKYDESKLNLECLENCAVELEEIYHSAENKN